MREPGKRHDLRRARRILQRLKMAGDRKFILPCTRNAEPFSQHGGGGDHVRVPRRPRRKWGTVIGLRGLVSVTRPPRAQWRAAEIFDTAGDDSVRTSARDAVGSEHDRVETAAALAVDGQGRHVIGETCPQRGEPRRIATAIERVAENHVVDRLRRDASVGQHGPDRRLAEFVGFHHLERAAPRGNGGAACGDEICRAHRSNSQAPNPQIRRSAWKSVLPDEVIGQCDGTAKRRGTLSSGEVQACMADQIGRRWARIRAKSQQRHQPLAPTFVDDTQEPCRNHGRMSLEHPLDLLRVNVLAGCDDHSAGAADEPQKPALVDHADVADRYRVAVTGQQRFASAGIIHEKKRTCHEHLTGLSRREASPEMVADGQTYTCEWTPHGVSRDIPIVLRHSGEAQLGSAVELGKTCGRKLPSQLRHRAALPFGTGRQDPTHGCKRWHALAHGGLDHQFELVGTP